MSSVTLTLPVEEVTQFLATVPTPEQILAFHASPAVQELPTGLARTAAG